MDNNKQINLIINDNSDNINNTNFERLNKDKYPIQILEIKKLYDMLIDNYVILNNSLELNNPIEIYSMFNFMINNGYLSKNGTFNFGLNNTVDIKCLLGANVITGNAVCRHISSMLNDIYNRLNINSYTCLSYCYKNKLIIMLIEKFIDLLTKQLNVTTNNEERNEIQILLTNSEKYKNFLKFHYLRKKSSKHMINLVSQNNIGYIIDPTNEHIYKKDFDFINLCKEILKSYVVFDDTMTLKLIRNGDIFDKNLEEILLLPDSNLEEDKILIEKVNSLCEKNIDLLDKFRIENKDLYYEINNKLIKVKIKTK